VGGDDHNLRIPFLLALRAKGFHPSAAGTGDPAPFERAGIDFHRLEFGRFLSPIADWRALNTISELLACLRPRLVQCFDTKPYLLVPLAARRVEGVHVVSTINGLGWLYSSRSPLALGLRPVYEELQRWASRATSVTVFQNREDQSFFARRRMLGAGGNLVIPGSGVEVDRFKSTLAAGSRSDELRETLGIGRAQVVMTVARLTRQKGIPTLLKAAALVHRQRPDVRFLLVGPRESEGRFAVSQAEIERHAPYVQALGARSDVPALLSLADVFAFPSEYREGIPRVLLEAAVAGRAIVATKMPGCTDVIRDGWSGFLVPPRSPRLLADRILELLRDRELGRVMGTRAAAFAEQEFDLETTVARYAAVYNELASS
jgi:glycosyltransferase involved in cell wall biosynthesis